MTSQEFKEGVYENVIPILQFMPYFEFMESIMNRTLTECVDEKISDHIFTLAWSFRRKGYKICIQYRKNIWDEKTVSEDEKDYYILVRKCIGKKEKVLAVVYTIDELKVLVKKTLKVIQSKVKVTKKEIKRCKKEFNSMADFHIDQLVMLRAGTYKLTEDNIKTYKKIGIVI